MRSKTASLTSANNQPGRNLALVIGLYLLVGLPFILLILLALGQVWRFPDVLPPAYSLDAVIRIISADSGLLSGLVLSITLSGTVAVVATGLGFLVARAVARSRWSDWWVTLSYLPYALPPVLLAVVIQPSIIRLRLSGSVGGVLLGMLLITLPFTTLFFRSFWSRQATQYEQLAQTLGCTPAQALTRVLLPLARPLLVTCLFQTFLIGWFDFGLTNFLSVGKVRTLTVQVFTYVREANSRLAAVASLLLILLPAILFWLNKSAIAPRTVGTDNEF